MFAGKTRHVWHLNRTWLFVACLCLETTDCNWSKNNFGLDWAFHSLFHCSLLDTLTTLLLLSFSGMTSIVSLLSCSSCWKRHKSCLQYALTIYGKRWLSKWFFASYVSTDSLCTNHHHHYQALSPSPTSTVYFYRNARTNEHLNILQSRKREMNASVECSSLRHDGLWVWIWESHLSESLCRLQVFQACRRPT